MRNEQSRLSSTYIARAGVIAAVYAAFTLITIFVLQGFAWGPIQFRISEAITVLAMFTPAGVLGLTVGCVIANLIAIPFTGVGALGLLDVIFGSLATLLGALWMRKFVNRPKLALLGPVLFNALIVPLYLPILLQGLGFYTIPFTEISLDGAFIPMYLFGLIATAIGQFVVVYGLGYPLYKVFSRMGLFADDKGVRREP